jgi:hypothetical protein
MTQKTCRRCGLGPVEKHDELYCKDCKKLVLDELRGAGYLTPKPWWRPNRPTDSQENVWETKHGTGHG